MLARLRARLCPRCLRAAAGPVAEHPTLLLMQRTERRLDRLLAMTTELLGREEVDARRSGNWARDLVSGVYGDEEADR